MYLVNRIHETMRTEFKRTESDFLPFQEAAKYEANEWCIHMKEFEHLLLTTDAVHSFPSTDLLTFKQIVFFMLFQWLITLDFDSFAVDYLLEKQILCAVKEHLFILFLKRIRRSLIQFLKLIYHHK